MMRLLLICLGRLPLHVLHALGAAAGWVTYVASPTYARRLRENLRASVVCADAHCEALIKQNVAETGKGVLELARETGALAAKAREGKLSPAEMQGGTFSISSLGGIGGTNFTPIINAPEVAILGVSRSDMKPVWNEDTQTFEPRLMLPLSLSYDHRVIDGAAGARFNAYLAQVLADFRRVLL